MWLSQIPSAPLRLGTPSTTQSRACQPAAHCSLPLSFLSPPGQCHGRAFQGSAQVLPHLKNLLHGHISSLLPSFCEVLQKHLGSLSQSFTIVHQSFFHTHLPSLGWNVLGSAGMITLMAMLQEFLTARYINSMLLLRFFFLMAQHFIEISFPL